jgi:hypothetical protein
MLGRRLAVTERRIPQLKGHVDCQRAVIDALEAAGRGKTETADIARDLLGTLERNLRSETAHRKWLRNQLRVVAAEI